jgi:hypothetical protein
MHGVEGGIANGVSVRETAPASKEEAGPAKPKETEENENVKEGPCGLPSKCVIL